MTWQCTKAPAQSLPSTHNNDGKASTTAQHRVPHRGDHIAPCEPIQEANFQVGLSLIYSIACTQIAYIYKLITATWILGDKAAMNDFEYFT